MKFIRISLMSIVVFLYSSNCQAQNKQKINYQDYKLWHSLAVGPASSDGAWVSFSKQYKHDTDTLYLKNTTTEAQYEFPLGRAEKITSKGDLFAFLKQDTLYVLKTRTGKMQKYMGVKKFEIAKDGKFLVYLDDTSSSNTLNILNPRTEEIKKNPDVKEYSFNPEKTKIAIVQGGAGKTSVKIMELADSKPPYLLFQSTKLTLQGLRWNATGKTLAYYATDKITGKHTIIYHKDLKAQPIRLQPSSLKRFPTDSDIVLNNLYISENGKKVFFDIIPKEDTEKNVNVKVWNSSDKQLPPAPESLKWSVWFPEENKFFQIENNTYENPVLTSDQNKVMLFNEYACLPFYKTEDLVNNDVYIMNLQTGKRKKIIEKQLTTMGHILVSQKSDLIAYFKNNNWWTYNVKTDTHTCVTRQLQVSFKDVSYDRAADNWAYGFGGWTSTGQLLVYDQFDIWLISPNGKKHQKITNGRATGMRHRIPKPMGKSIRSSFFGFTAATYDAKKGVLIKTVDTNTLDEGFGIWTPKKAYRQIVQKDLQIFSIKRIKEKNSFLFSERAFEVAPRLMFVEGGGKQKQIAQSNTQQKQFYWGKSELIHYKGPNGEKLKGALFYPANFREGKKYPMIVDIYERESGFLNAYVPPSLENFTGINRTLYTLNGYFVLMPDIAYTLNSPGDSALQCVLAAVDEAVKIGAIDEKNIGLDGHSFGGFETAYIISQTDRFKTARAGAGVLDLFSFYLELDNSNRSNMVRFEKGQQRNKIPFTEAGFTAESPLNNVETIDTPLLLWAGGKDDLVSPWHSIKLYAALWRLQKPSTLLIYPDEIHVLINENNQKDLTLKTLDWYNHYLKDAPAGNWIK